MLSVLAKGLLFVILFKSQRELRKYPTVPFNQVNAAADNGPIRETWQVYLKEITGHWPMDSACVDKKRDKYMNR